MWVGIILIALGSFAPEYFDIPNSLQIFLVATGVCGSIIAHVNDKVAPVI